MKRILNIILACLLLCSCTATSGGSNSNDTPTILPTDKVLHTDGRLLISPEGEQIIIKGMAMGNEVWGNPDEHSEVHHDEDAFRELSEMGFNSVRFYLNYGLFEDDSASYEYKESGFKWLDKNIAWAKKYGIGIIFNMHYPQGGYQSQGEGDALWTDVENQNRLVALWTEIARRYADESTVWGYGLINEPVVSWQGSKEATLEHYRAIQQRITDSIRTVSNQAIIIEKMCAVDYGDTTDWNLSIDESMPIVNGENIIYEFHDYTPHSFTHQDMDWANTKGVTGKYPDESHAMMTMSSYWEDCISATKKSEDGDWSYFEASRAYKGTENYNVGALAINGARIGEGAAYFDDITVTEIAPDGTETVIIDLDFDQSMTSTFSLWSQDGSGKLDHVYTDGYTSKGCLRVTGATADYTATQSTTRFVLKEGYSYKISGYIKRVDTGSGTLRIDYGIASSYSYLNKDYLESDLMNFIDWSKEHNVPLYMGEFGACNNCFLYGRGGEIWVGDMMDLCREYDLSFNYHTYHEGSFGLHSNSNALPTAEDLNQALYDCLVKELNK